MRVGRLTIDLLRPVPLQPLKVTHEVVRKGRQIAVVDAAIWWDDRLVSRASAMFVLTDHKVRSSTRKRIAGQGPPIPGKDTDPRDEFKSSVLEGFEIPGFAQSMEMRRVVGLPTRRITQVLGYSNGDEVIHRDDLVLVAPEEREAPR